MANHNRSFCADFSTVLDYSYACVTLTDEERQVFRSVHARVEQQLPRRSLLVRLDCSPEIELQRIRRRHRSAERTITVDYLARINNALMVQIEKLPRDEKVLVIDSNSVNFAHDPVAQACVRRKIDEAFGNV